MVVLGICGAGLLILFFILSRGQGALRSMMGGAREAQSEKLIREFSRAAAVSGDRIYAKSRQLEALTKNLAGANLTLEQLNNMKSKFLSVVAHDVRTPLAAIRGYSELFSKAATDDRHRNMSRNMSSAVDRLNLLISDLTDVAMIEAGKLKIERARFPFGALVNDLMSSIEINARNKGVSLKYDRIHAEAVVNGDSFRLSQVLQNLLNNAIKFTPSGGLVEISTRLEGRWLIVNVKDSGAGIHPSEIRRIFEKFYQAKYQKDEKIRKMGWGLGLSIAQEIVVRHGGEIGAVSAGLGKGSTFWFKVPASFTSSV